MDFNAVDDRIWLDDAVFVGLGLGRLRSAAFTANATGKALDAMDRIVYETGTGKLYFDSDGTGANARVHFATLEGGPAVTAADFLVF